MMHVDLSSKRARLAIRFFTYGVMTLATILLTIVAVFFAMGYRFDQSNLSFQQGGLVQFGSYPANARVIIDGKDQSVTTPGRADLPAGSHTITMNLNGYRSWQKTITLAAGQLLWLDYTRLLPNTITTSTAANFTGVTGAMASPDHKWMLVQDAPDQATFQLVDFNDPKKPVVTDVTIPAAQITNPGGTYTINEWDLSSRYILIEHTNGDVHEFLRIDRNHAANAINISLLFSLNITEAHFAGSNPDLLYARTDAVLRTLDVGSKSASAVLVSGVKKFTVYGSNTVAFVADRDIAGGNDATKQQVVGVYTNGKETIVRTFAPNAPVSIAYSEYTNHAYLAITAGDGTAAILRDPTTSKSSPDLVKVSLGKQIQWMKFSSNGRILVVGNGSDVATYDLELAKLTAWTVSGAPMTAPLQWLDDYYLYTDAGGSLRIFEYDSTNGRDITSVTAGLTAGLSQDGSYLYSFFKDAGGTVTLQSSKLVNN